MLMDMLLSFFVKAFMKNSAAKVVKKDMAKSFKVRAEKVNRSGLAATIMKAVIFDHSFLMINDDARAVITRKIVPNSPA